MVVQEGSTGKNKGSIGVLSKARKTIWGNGRPGRGFGWNRLFLIRINKKSQRCRTSG